MLHGSLKPDLHHWSADSLGLFLCSYGWDTGPDLSRYLEAIAILKEEVSFRAFHPFFAPGTFPLKSARARQACRYLFDFFEPVLRRRLAFRSDSTAPQDTLGKLAPLHRDARQSATPWSHEDCVEELISLVAEGTGAMSYTVAQALVLLSRNPDAQQAAWEQARLVEPAQVEQGRAGTGKAAALNPFMLSMVRETMRLFPALPCSFNFPDAHALDLPGMAVPTRTNVMWMKTAAGQSSSNRPARSAARRTQRCAATPA